MYHSGCHSLWLAKLASPLYTNFDGKSKQFTGNQIKIISEYKNKNNIHNTIIFLNQKLILYTLYLDCFIQETMQSCFTKQLVKFTRYEWLTIKFIDSIADYWKAFETPSMSFPVVPLQLKSHKNQLDMVVGESC